MGDELSQNTMNLDLNLGPGLHPSQIDHPQTMSFEDWLNGPMRDAGFHGPRTRQRLRSLWRPVPIPMGARNTAQQSTGSSGLVIDARNPPFAAVGDNNDDDDDEQQPPETIKTDGNVGKKDLEEDNGDGSSFFDCNICLDLASDPVVTCCGHLFCWPCLYRWLFVHSDLKECPICKGEVTMKTITPIYSRGNASRSTHVTECESSLKIPTRPQATRIESWRQSIQRTALSIPMFEMIRRLDNRLGPTQVTGENPRVVLSSSLLNRVFTSRGMRRSQPDAAMDSPQTSPGNPEPGGSGSMVLTEQSNHGDEMASGSFVESYFVDYPDEQNEEQMPLLEDRHSMSSIAAIIQSDSQTAVETDSRVSVSTSRRCEPSTSRVSDVDSGDSRPRTRRRRLQ